MVCETRLIMQYLWKCRKAGASEHTYFFSNTVFSMHYSAISIWSNNEPAQEILRIYENKAALAN